MSWILYCFICDDCGCTFEEFCPYNNQLIICKVCGGDLRRDYMAENKSVRSDFKPGFNSSIGVPYSGRRDLLNKMRGAGFYPMAHGGGLVTGSTGRYYGDEEYQDKIMKRNVVDHRYKEILHRTIEEGQKEDGKIIDKETDGLPSSHDGERRKLEFNNSTL